MTEKKRSAQADVTVIIPVYKVEQFLHTCLDSLLSQTYPHWKAILVDDGSPDNCGRICDEYAARDARFHVIHKANGGLSSARNAALDCPPNGELSSYVTFLDSDDFLAPCALEEMMKLAETYDADIVQCGFVRGSDTTFPPQKKTPKVKVYDNHSVFTSFTAKVIPCSKLYKSELIGDTRFPVGLYNEDDFTTWKFYYHARRIVVTSAAYYYYSVNPNSTMANLRRKPDLRYFNAYREQISFFQNTGEKDLEAASRMQWMKNLVLSTAGKTLDNEQRAAISEAYNENHKALYALHQPIPLTLDLIFRSYKITPPHYIQTTENHTISNIKMRILLVTDEVWNDRIFGNGVLTNWFTDFDAEFAQIYCSPGLPYNNVCQRYFQVTDADMAKSLLGKGRAGYVQKGRAKPTEQMQAMHPGIYGKMKKIATRIHTPMMMIRDAIWLWGRYDKRKLQQFIDDFKPDVVYCPRLLSPKLLRLERLISRITNAPIVAFTGDNEVSYSMYTLSPLAWLRRWYTRKMFSSQCGIYDKYLMHSRRQANEYCNDFRLDTDVIYKCTDGAALTEIEETIVHQPIRMIYAGRLYCNRWKTLAQVGEALKKINKDKELIRLDIYTQDNVTDKQREALSEDKHVYLKGSVTPDQLHEIYLDSDIALHVESMDKAPRLSTQYSFSTKIIDLLSSGCAVMAICWEKQCGFEYLKDNEAAICISDFSKIEETLRELVEHPNRILEYKAKAMACALANHSRSKTHKDFMEIFNSVIAKKKQG